MGVATRAINPTTSMNFLRRDPLYNKEKPYLCLFELPEGFPKTNIQLEKCQDLVMEDCRGRESDFTLEQNGFGLMLVDAPLSYEDYDNDEKIRSIYLPSIGEALRKYTGATRVQTFEHVVRKRHEIFPISTGEPYAYNQPTSIAHIDTTHAWTVEMVKKLNPGKAAALLERRVQCVNVWKPLRGPVRDWPLGLCDASTVDRDDVQPGDLVYGDYVVENCQVHRDERQRWYYIRDQSPAEAWVFIQSDSAFDRPGVPHSSFPNPQSSPDDIPRESIEVRALVYY